MIPAAPKIYANTMLFLLSWLRTRMRRVGGMIEGFVLWLMEVENYDTRSSGSATAFCYRSIEKYWSMSS